MNFVVSGDSVRIFWGASRRRGVVLDEESLPER